MRVSELAKQYLRQCLSEASLDEEALDGLVSKDHALMSRNELSQHNGALHMMSSAMMAVAKKRKEISFEAVAAEIDRREALIGNGWLKEGTNYTKAFDTPSDMLDAIRIMKGCGLGVSAPHAPTDNTTTLVISEKYHQRLVLLLEGRSMEIE